MFKQIIVIRTDLNMSTGKKCAQSCHASLGSYRKSDNKIRELWRKTGEKKVVVGIGSKKEMIQLFERSKDEKIPAYLVQDAGLTELEPGTMTALGIGPEEEDKIDRLTIDLNLLK